MNLIFKWLGWNALGWGGNVVDNFMLISLLCKGKSGKIWLTMACVMMCTF